MLMTNGDDYFHRHFSADEFCKYAELSCIVNRTSSSHLLGTHKIIDAHELSSAIIRRRVYDNDVYFTLATSDSRIGKYKTAGEQLTHKNRSIYSAIG